MSLSVNKAAAVLPSEGDAHTHQCDHDVVFCANRPVDAPLRVNGRDAEQWVCAEEMCPWEERHCL